MPIIPAKKINQEDIKEILNLKKEDIDINLIRSYFGCHMDQANPRFNTYDKFTLPAGKLFNDTPIETTVGKYITNFFVLPEKYLKKFGYVNKAFNKDTVGDLEKKMGNMILNNEMTTKEYADYLDRGEWLGMAPAYFLAPTMDYDINVPIPEVIKLRDELFEKYADGVKKGDSNVANEIEKEVLALAKQKIKEKGNEAYDYFESGIGKFGNNYKKTSIMGGAIENPYTKKLEIVKSNYVDGISKEEFPTFTNLTILGGYGRGVETQSSGYMTKKINNAMQGISLDEHGSDCGTKNFIELELLPDIKKLFIDRYIVDAGGLVLLTAENIDKYVGKKVKLRSPLTCKSEKICNKCAGELFYKMGMDYPGLLSSTISGVLMNLSMKKIHDATVKFSQIDVEKFIKKH